MDKVSETIKVSKETKQSLIRVAAKLQESSGKRVDLDEAIQHLVSASEKRPDLLEKAFGSASGIKIEDMLNERRLDERRAKRKYRI